MNKQEIQNFVDSIIAQINEKKSEVDPAYILCLVCGDIIGWEKDNQGQLLTYFGYKEIKNDESDIIVTEMEEKDFC